MITPRKKICLLFCSTFPGLQKDKLGDWLKQMPELNIIADIEPIFIFGKNAVDTTPDVWIKIAEQIYQRLSSCSGFVVISGIDNVLYTSAAVSFLLKNLSRPVVFTGSPAVSGLNFDPKKLGIKANLINSIQVATYNLPAVCLMFGNRLLRANQASQLNDESLNIFSTSPAGILGRIDFSIRVFENLADKTDGKTKFYHELNTNIEIIYLNPLFDFRALAQRIAGCDGIIVNAGDYQNLPDDLISLTEKVSKDKPIIIWSKKIKPQVLDQKNFLIITNMTWSATMVKLMWVLAQSKNIKIIKELMEKNISGEIIY